MAAAGGSTRERRARVLAAVSVALAAAATAVLAFGGVGTEEVDGRRDGGDASAALYGVAVAAVALLALLVPPARRFVAVGLLAFSLLGAASIGLLFAPAALAMLLAVLMGPPVRR